MPTVWIPPQLRDLTDGREAVSAAGATVREVIDVLEQIHPGIRERLCVGEELRSGIAVVVDAQVAPLGLLQPVKATSEIHFLPAVGGG